MTTPAPDALCGRLRAMEGDFYTRLWTHRAADLIQQQKAEIERLSAALEPFVEALDEWGDDERVGDDATLWEHPLGMCITTGDFRRAHAALGKDEKE